MATLDDAKSAWNQTKRGFRKNTPTRTAFLGNGGGYAASNIVVAGNPSMFYARERLSDKAYFVVPNYNSNVNPKFNLPVVLGYDQTNPGIEQILGVDMSAFPYQSAASVLGGLAPHHAQHEFGGGDEVFIDAELIKIGLFTPDNPPTLGGYVQPFYYSSKTTGLQVFGGSRLDSISSYIPATSGTTRMVSITLNPDSGSLVYRASAEFSANISGSATLEELLAGGGSVLIPGGSATLPKVPGGEIPIATFALTSTTASLNWSATNSNYYHSRLFLGKVDTDIYSRLDTIETKVGVSPLPRLGAGGTGLWNKNIHDGDFRIGRINDQQWTGTSSPSWGNKLYFSGALGTASWNSENSDELWMARYNADNNVSHLRMSLGDDDGSTNIDSFQIGTTSLGGIFTPEFSFTSDNKFRIWNSGFSVGFTAPTLSGDQIWTLPSTDGSAGQAIVTDGSGNLGWSSGSIMFSNLPTGDPGVPGVLYQVAGAVMISL